MLTFPTKETMTIEFKSDRKCLPESTLIDAVVGMANAEGGLLYLGIEDNGMVTGLHPNHKDPIRMAATIADNTVPPVSVRIDILDEASQPSVMQIRIPASNSITATRSGKVLRRRLNVKGEPQSLPLYPYELSAHLAGRGMLDLSAQPLSDAAIDDLDPAEIKHLRTAINKWHGETSLLTLTDEDLLKALHLITDISGANVPTIAGMLLLGDEARLLQLLPAAQTAFQVFNGTELRVNRISHKPLLTMMDNCLDLLTAWNPTTELADGLFRIPIPEFNEDAFREALVNAFAHRDYTKLSLTRIIINEEGLTISSPGSFINGVNLKNLLTAEPHGRNPALADALKRIGLAERSGRGIDRIFAGSIIYGRPWPDYSESDEETVKVFIPRAHPDLPFARILADEREKTGQPLPINSMLILSLLRTEYNLSSNEISNLTNISAARLRPVLHTLLEHGLIETKGQGKSQSYILSARLYKGSKNTSTYIRQAGIDAVRQPELVLNYIKAQGSISRSETVELLHIAPSAAYRLLTKMLSEKSIQRKGKGRSACYILV
jgi:ATP-dependent DNA helicase RecG